MKLTDPIEFVTEAIEQTMIPIVLQTPLSAILYAFAAYLSLPGFSV